MINKYNSFLNLERGQLFFSNLTVMSLTNFGFEKVILHISQCWYLFKPISLINNPYGLMTQMKHIPCIINHSDTLNMIIVI